MRRVINAAIIKDKKLLLFKKNLTWILPGGKPNYAESDLETLLREFKEEASGREIIINSYYDSFIGITPHTKKILKSFVYLADLKNPDKNIRPSGEIIDTGFFDYSEICKIKVSDITSKAIESLSKRGYI